MDHRVSKDMISSGMTPSGEKTQADLGKTQYGSAPSPSRLMDAYYSMYQNQKEETVDEGKIPAGLQAYLDKKKGKKGKDDEDHGDEKKGKKGKKSKGGKPDFLDLDKDGDKKESMKKASKEKKESVDLLAAYHAVYEHHQKDENGNTIPHDGEELDENLAGIAAKGLQMASRGASKMSQMAAKGSVRAKQLQAQGGVKKALGQKVQSAKKKLALTSGQKEALLGRTTAGKITRGVGALAAAGLAGRMSAGGGETPKPSGIIPGSMNYYRDLNFDYTPEGDMISEDLFDALKSALIEEGCDEKTSIKIMTSITPDYFNEIIQEENLDEAIVTGSILAGLAAKKLLGLGAGIAAKKAAAAAALKGAKVAAGKAVSSAVLKGAAKAGTMSGKLKTAGGVKGLAGKGLKSMAKNPVNTALTASMVMPQKGPAPQADQRAKAAGRRTAGAVTASADLFDIVKGRLLDEGLTEEECNDVMTTLTLEEINETLQLDEISGKLAMKASRAADMKRAQLAKAGDKAGAAAKAAQASRLYKGGAKRNLAKQDLSKPLNPQRTDYPMGKGASYQQKPGMNESLTDAYLKVYEGSGEGFGEKPEGSEEKPIEKKVKPKKERMTQQDRNFARKTFGGFNRKFGK